MKLKDTERHIMAVFACELRNWMLLFILEEEAKYKGAQKTDIPKIFHNS